MNPHSEPMIPGQAPSELREHRILGEAFLKNVPRETIQQAEATGCPWLHLSTYSEATAEQKRFFEVGRSVSKAITALLLVAAGVARGQTSKRLTMKSGRALLKKLYGFGFYKDSALTPPEIENLSDKDREILDGWIREEEDLRRKREGSHWRPKDLPTLQDLLSKYPQELFMISSWLQWGPDCFGLCFFSERDMVTVMQTVFPDAPSADPDKYFGERMRQRLGLSFYNPKRPLALNAKLLSDGLIEVEYQGFRDFHARSTDPQGSRTEKFKLPPIEYSGFRFYPKPDLSAR